MGSDSDWPVMEAAAVDGADVVLDVARRRWSREVLGALELPAAALFDGLSGVAYELIADRNGREIVGTGKQPHHT